MASSVAADAFVEVQVATLEVVEMVLVTPCQTQSHCKYIYIAHLLSAIDESLKAEKVDKTDSFSKLWY